MVAEFGHLSPEDKILKALELSSQGLSRKEVSSLLYNTKGDKNRLGALRKHMQRHNYVWDDKVNQYVLSEGVSLPNKEPQTKINKQKQTSTNKQEPTTINKEQTKTNKPVVKQRKSTLKPIDSLTQEDVVALKGMIQEFASLKASLEGEKEVSGAMESPLTYSTFTGALQSTTLQLHSEVWDALDDFCGTHKVTKKAVVNQAIFDFLRKQDKTGNG